MFELLKINEPIVGFLAMGCQMGGGGGFKGLRV
jgi:hypothetical protein